MDSLSPVHLFLDQRGLSQTQSKFMRCYILAFGFVTHTQTHTGTHQETTIQSNPLIDIVTEGINSPLHPRTSSP